MMFDGSALPFKETWNGRDELPIMPMNMASHSNAKS
ncbi:hypothetical protein AAULR_03074, partial [Lacticaseibacillus rhamnosus MTCC 5462]